MSVSVPAATNAVQEYLESLMELDDDIVKECHELLEGIWHIDNSQIRVQIIQTAALNVGLLVEDDL